MLPQILAVASAILALAAFLRARSVQRKIATISQSYWQLRYDFAQLRARLAKLDGGPAAPPDEPQSHHSADVTTG